MDDNDKALYEEILDKLETIEEALNTLHRVNTSTIEDIEAEIAEISMILEDEFSKEPPPEGCEGEETTEPYAISTTYDRKTSG